MEKILRVGSSGPEVTDLQSLLNGQLVPSPRLRVDGIFGPRTRAAVVAFQRANWLITDGVVGICTFNALRGEEEFVVLRRPAKLVPQPDETTCWAASTAMLTNLSVPEVVTRAKAAGVDVTNGLPNDSNTKSFTNTQLFANTFGLTMLYPQSWIPSALATMLRAHGPLMMDTLWSASDYVAGAGSSGHMRVIAGMRGDSTGEAATTLLYDPWSPGIGKIESVLYGPLVRRDPASTYQIFYR